MRPMSITHLNVHGLNQHLKKLQKELQKELLNEPATEADVPELTERICSIQDNLDSAQSFIASSGQIQHFKSFIVEFFGSGGVEFMTMSEAVELSEGASPAKKLPTLYSAVESWLIESGTPITERGYGLASWHLGAHCTPGEAWLLSKGARKQFSKAIKAGLLTVQIQPWSMEPLA